MIKTKKNKIIYIIVVSALLIAVLFSTILLNKNFNWGKTTSVVNNYETGGSGRGAVGGTRITYNFNYGWTFSKGSGKLNYGTSWSSTDPVSSVTYIPNPTVSSSESDIPYSLNYVPGNTWKEVSLPHTYNDEDTFNNYTETGLNGERTMYAGTAWYKKSFSLPSSYSTGKKIIIEFEAARQAAKVWINGNLLEGTYENGFIAFGYEIPNEYLNFGENETNDITVMVDNSYPYKMEGTNSSVTWHDSHWHPNYGGLYRNSYLYVVDDLHLTVPLYSFTQGSGTYVYTTEESSATAHVNIDAEVKNSSNVTRTFTYRSIIKDMNGETLLTINSPSSVTLNAGETNNYQLTGVLNNPKRWSTNYPYLYTCETQILENDVVIDNNLNTFGIRTFRFTNDYGFYLNEYYTEIDGWGQKATWEWAAVGAAYPDWMTEYSVKMLKDAGGNYIRFGHVSGSSVQIGMCDKYGIMVTQPGVDGEGESSSGGGTTAYSENTYRLRIEAMRDLIIYFRNHPSIIMWELGNQSLGLQRSVTTTFNTSLNWLEDISVELSTISSEAPSSASIGDKYFNNSDNLLYTYDGTSWGIGTVLTSNSKYINLNDNMIYREKNGTLIQNTYAGILYDVIGKYDYGNRNGITSAGSYDETSTSSNRLITIRHGSTAVVDYVDVAETTEASGGMTTPSLGNKPSIEGEYNRLEARRGVWDKSTLGFTSFVNTTSNGTDYLNSTSETFALKQVSNKKTVLTNTAKVGGANWIFSDSISHGRLQSEVARASGEVDAVMLPKEAYYASKVINSEVPDMHIIGHWNYPNQTIKNIYVIAKGVDRVELFVNGTSVGNGVKSYDYQYTFSNISYEEGYIEAKGYDISNNIIVSDRIDSHGTPTKLRITSTNGPTGIKANGSDILILDVELLDENNNVCISYDGEVDNKLVNFTYDLDDNGNITGSWLGGYNSGVPENTRTDNLYLEAGITRVFVRTSKNAGNITVTASMDGVTSDTYNTVSNPLVLTSGLTTEVNPTTTYTLEEENNLGLGTGGKLGESAKVIATSKLYIENLSYSGTIFDMNGIYDGFTTGIFPYSDSGVKLVNVPYKYSNAEYLRLPYGDGGIVAEDLIVFSVTRDVTIFIARDENVPVPEWLTQEYTETTDMLTADDGTIYKIWTKNVTINVDQNNNVTNMTVVIGGNSDDGSDGLLGKNQFIFVKPTEKVNNRIFFNEDFNLFSMANVIYGWNAFIPDSLTTIERITTQNRIGLQLLDNASSSLAFIQKEFASLNRPFTFEFKAYMPSNVNTVPGVDGKRANNWLRVFLSKGVPDTISVTNGGTTSNIITNLAVETYLYRQENFGDRVYIKYRTMDDSSIQIAIDSANVVVENWYIYKYYVDPVLKKWHIEVYDETGTTKLAESEELKFAAGLNAGNQPIDVSSVNMVSFGTGVNRLYLTDYTVDDVIIKPIMDCGATSITINGNQVELDGSTESYLILDGTAPSNAEVSLTTTEDYYIHTRVNDDINNKISMSVENLNGDEYNFDIVFNGESILDEWTIGYENNTNTEASATTQIKDNEEAINLIDSTDLNNVFIHKAITPFTTAMKFSFDVFLDNNVDYSQEMIKVFLSNGLMDSQTDYSKLGVRSYLTPQDGTTNEYLIATKKVGSNDSNLMDDTIISKNTWHNVEYHVNISAGTYSVFLDNTEIIKNFEFYNQQSTINHIYFGTDVNATGKILLKNINYQEISAKPINGIIINQIPLPDFDPESDLFTYYTDETLTNDTNISLITNAFYDPLSANNTITKDIENRRIVINVVDKMENIYTYTVQYDSTINRPVSANELQTLVNYVNDNYISTDYTFNTWALVNTALTEAVIVLDPLNNSIPSEYSRAYYNLETSLSELLYLSVYTGYETSTIETIQYSNNLKMNDIEVFTFNKVLDNAKEVYNENNATLFTSVPYKYMNAEYMLVNNSYYKDALIVLKTLKAVDLLVFKDRDAGPLTEEGFTYTGEIATTSDGTVYKIYKKTYSNIGNNLNIEFEKIISNRITNKNNIIAFIETSKSNNNIFFNEDFDNYDITDLPAYTNTSFFERSWESEYPVKSSITDTTYAETTLDTNIDGRNALHLRSTSENTDKSTHAWGIAYKEIAKLYDTVVYKYSFKLVSGANNQYIRTWLRDYPGDYANNTGDTDKIHTAIELYIHANQIMATIEGKNTNIGTLVAGWNTVEITMNLHTRMFTIKLNTNNVSAERKMNNKSTTGTEGSNHNVGFVNHVYFASRYTWSTNAYLRDIEIYPVNTDFYSDINVAGTSIGNYHDLTKAYLYKLSDNENYNTASSTAIGGTLFGTNSINPTYATTTLENDKYTTIDETYSAYTRNYKVYYEVDSDNAETVKRYGKADLVDLINQVDSIIPALYTSDSYNSLILEKEDAIKRLANHNSQIIVIDSENDCMGVGTWNSVTETCTQTISESDCSSLDNGIWNSTTASCSVDVTGDYLELLNARNSLVSISNTSFKYDGKITLGKEYSVFESSEVNITNKSSLTASFLLENRITGNYAYENKTHTRFLNVDATLAVNTKITMINKYDNKVYYYKVTQTDYDNNKTKYALSDFKLVGTTDYNFINSYYINNNLLQEEYLFIIDFVDANGMNVGSHNMSLELYVDSDKKSTSDILSYTTYDSNSRINLETSASEDTYYRNQSINIRTNILVNNLTENGIAITDTTDENIKLGLKVSLYDSDGELKSFPKGTTIIDNDITYTLAQDGIFHISRGVGLQTINRDFQIIPGINGFSPGEYYINIEVIGSYDGINMGTVLASQNLGVIIVEEPDCSIKAYVTNSTYLIDLNKNRILSFEIDTTCNYMTTDKIITVSLHKKNNSIFNNFDYTLIDYNNIVENNIFSPYSSNIYEVISHPNTNYSTETYQDRYSVLLDDEMNSGLYKLVFDIRAGSFVMSDSLSFEVK